MFIIQLRLTKDRSKAAALMAKHRQWIDQGFREGVFLLVGTLEPGAGGAILAYNTTRAKLRKRIKEDPFVAEGVVVPEITEITPQRVTDAIALALK